MKGILITVVSLMAVVLIVAFATGDGAFKKKFTVSGIVTVHTSDKTTCFVDSEAHGISCLPDWFIEGKMPK